MRIFLAGGTGVIGRRLVPGLIDAGHELVVLARNPQRAAAAAELGAEVVQGDALTAANVRRLVAAAEPELIMHQLTDLSERSSAANAQLRIDGTRNLVQAALAADVGAIVLQSIAWVYAPGTGPATEDVALDLGAADPARPARRWPTPRMRARCASAPTSRASCTSTTRWRPRSRP